MAIENCVWAFSGYGNFPDAVFTTIEKAEKWIDANDLKGVFEGTSRHNLLNLRPEKIEEKSGTAKFIGGFSSASLEHYQYENGPGV